MGSELILVIGGGPAGLETARDAADLGARVLLLEEREQLGGTPVFEGYAALTHGFQDEEVMRRAIRETTSQAGEEFA